MHKAVPLGIKVQKIKEYAGHKGSIYAMALSPDESRLYTGGDDGIVVAWDLVENADEGQGVLRIPSGIYAMHFLEGWNLLAVGASDGTVYLVDPEEKKIVHNFARSKEAIYGFFHQKGGNTLWVLHGGGFLSIHSLHDFSERSFFRLSPNHLRSIALDEVRQKIYIGSSDNRILVLNSESGKLEENWEAHENSVFSLMVHQEGKYLLSGSMDAHFHVWDLESHQLLEKVAAHNFTINDFTLLPKGRHFVTASRDKSIKVWDAYGFELLKVIDYAKNEGHTHSVNKIRWLSTDNSLISCGDDRRVIRWDLAFSE